MRPLRNPPFRTLSTIDSAPRRYYTVMKGTHRRKPFALANWKMAMTVSETLGYSRFFQKAAGELPSLLDIVLCPPFTAIHALSQALKDTPIQVGAQNMSAAPGNAHTGEISAPLLVEAGCTWVILGHWEIRRRTGETDRDFNKKMLAGAEEGLRSILLIGEGVEDRGRAREVLEERLPLMLLGSDPKYLTQCAIVYEPEWTIGAEEPASPDYISSSCRFIRYWIRESYGAETSSEVRIIYGGGVTPEHVDALLTSPDVDGLGAGRKGRDPKAFAEIVRKIATAKGLIP